MKLTRLTAGLFALLIVSGAVVSCGDEAKTPAETTPVGTKAVETEETEAPAVQRTLYSEQLEAQDFGGAEYRLYADNSLVGMELPTTINIAIEETGEVVNDTLFARDRWIEETFNVDMVDTIGPGYSDKSKLSKSIMAGDDVYDLLIVDASTDGAYYYSSAGLSYPLNAVKTLNLDKPYWMPEVNEKLKVAGDLYLSASPISPRYYGSVYVIQFNRDLARALDIGDLYEDVQNGKWTFDRMMECARLAERDLDGDGKMTVDDQYGLVYEVLTPEALILGTDMHVIENQGGTLKVMLNDPKMVDLFQKMTNFFLEPCVGIVDNGGPFLLDETILHNGNYLFRNPCTFDLAAYRDLTYDYGILPMPKLDESQKNYVGYSQPWATACPVIPISVNPANLDRIGVITDAMCAYGYDYVKPAVFDNVIQLKGARDEKSAEIIDQMFENVTFEYMSIADFGGIASTLHKFFMGDLGKKDITSTYQKIQPKVESAIEALVAQYAKNAENR
ncbi:MAG: hypothetical protein MJ175_09840 [Clostridia bacterium]|nr:hypothetical protein [Clostridia bacterium]